MSEDTAQAPSDTSDADAVAAAVAPTEKTVAANASTTETPTAWAYAEDVPGEGDAPDWFKSGKYKTVQAQAEAYNALESKFGSFTGAPEAYELNASDELTEAGVTFADDDGMVGEFKTLATDMGINQEGFDKMLNLYGMVQLAEATADQESRKVEMDSLGTTAQTRIDNISNWGKANMSAEQYQTFEGMFNTAGSIAVMERMIARTAAPSIAPAQVVAQPSITQAKLTEMQFAKDQYGARKMNDPSYRAEFNRLNKELNPGDHNVTIG